MTVDLWIGHGLTLISGSRRNRPGEMGDKVKAALRSPGGLS
jgi:hypothetical protein